MQKLHVFVLDTFSCVAFILQHMDEDEQDKIVELFTDETNAPSVKYQPGQQTFLTNLTLMLWACEHYRAYYVPIYVAG